MWPRRLSTLAFMLLPLSAYAQTLTWTPIDLPDVDETTRPFLAIGVTSDGSFLLDGRRAAYLRTSDGTLTEITCPNLPHAPGDLRRSPFLEGLNSALTVVGTEVVGTGIAARVVGVVREASGGACQVIQVPDTLKEDVGAVVNTFVTGISNANARIGFAQGANVDLGRRRFFGWQQAPDGTFALIGGICDRDEDGLVSADAIEPEAIAGDYLTFGADCGLQPSNRYRYEGGFCQAGTCQTLRGPGGEQLALPAVTEDGRAYAYEAHDHGVISGGKSWIVNLAATPPAFTDFPLPPASTPGGTVEYFTPRAASATRVIGMATERLDPATCPPPDQPSAICIRTFQWLGTLDTAETPPPEDEKKDRERAKREREEHDKITKGGLRRR